MPEPTQVLGRVAILGAGRAGCSLAAALGECTLVCRSSERRAKVAAWLASAGLTKVQLVAELDPAGAIDVLVFAVPDRALAAAAAAAAELPPGSTKAWLHLSGALSADVLRVPGGSQQVGAMHPLCALPDPVGANADAPRAAAPLRGALCALGGEAEPAARALAERIGGLAFVLPAASRPAYHAAAALVANDLVALLALGVQASVQAGVPPELAVPGLVHLASSSLAAVASRSLADGLTGAVSRGDAGTLAAHLSALKPHPPAAAVHAALSEVLLGLVAERLPPEHAAAVAAVLRQPEPLP